ASFMLIAAMNPCPCGFLGDMKHDCRCTPLQVRRYRSKISGPLMDRIDIHMEVPAVRFRDLTANGEGRSSKEIYKRVKKARLIQAARFSRSKVHVNSGMSTRQMKKFCRLDGDSRDLLERAMDRFGLSARAHSRILKIARTIADLEESQEVNASHVAEAIQYRSLDRRLL
ncbi:MAG: ATP-binding protein, partial [Deltaproteobacteria bacterium]|nr:ATP-binding protein [Deltaproteobacteria bacterium]